MQTKNCPKSLLNLLHLIFTYIAEEKAAKQARIQERLAQSLGSKKSVSANTKATKSGPTSNEERHKPPKTTMTTEQQSSRINEKQKPSDQISSKTPHQSSSKKLEADRKLGRPSMEPDSKNRDMKSKKTVETVCKGQPNAKKGAPLNFKELLAAAERNKNGGAILQSGLDGGNSLKNSGSNGESSNVKKKSLEDKSVKQEKSAKHEKTTVTTDSKRLTKSVPNGKSLPSVKDSSIKKDFKSSSGLVNGSREKKLASKTSSSIGATSGNEKISHSKYSNSTVERRSVKELRLGQKRDRAELKRKRNPYVDEMDDFIDDGDDDDDDEVPDVSKYIREIFGYDKTRLVSRYKH